MNKILRNNLAIQKLIEEYGVSEDIATDSMFIFPIASKKVDGVLVDVNEPKRLVYMAHIIDARRKIANLEGVGSGQQYTQEDMLAAIAYGFTYYRDSQNDGVDVPQGNKLQWLQYHNNKVKGISLEQLKPLRWNDDNMHDSFREGFYLCLKTYEQLLKGNVHTDIDLDSEAIEFEDWLPKYKAEKA